MPSVGREADYRARFRTGKTPRMPAPAGSCSSYSAEPRKDGPCCALVPTVRPAEPTHRILPVTVDNNEVGNSHPACMKFQLVCGRPGIPGIQ